MPKIETKTEPGSESKLYGQLPPLTYSVVTLENTGDAALGEALEVCKGNAELAAKYIVDGVNSAARNSAGGAFLGFLKYARKIVQGGGVSGVSIAKGEAISPVAATIVQSLAKTMFDAATALQK